AGSGGHGGHHGGYGKVAGHTSAHRERRVCVEAAGESVPARVPSRVAGPAAGCRRFHRRLGRTDLHAVPEIRRELRKLLRQWGGCDRTDVAQLLASELVTNALLHTEQGAVVTATVASSTLRVEVRDFITGLPVPDTPSGRRFDSLDTNGRGLFLVQSLADSWGVRAQGMGKVVWFEIHRPSEEGPEHGAAGTARAAQGTAAGSDDGTGGDGDIGDDGDIGSPGGAEPSRRQHERPV
ncbi:ATP-binding protein, partial [Streptomyces clavuligerus]